ncbi:MAG: hypothetical protein ACKO21_04550 [Nodosilinea sp.]
MESVLTDGFELGAELSDLRVIEVPRGTSRPPSNIVKRGQPFDLYTDIHFVGTLGNAWPTVAVDIQYFLEGYGNSAIETQTSLVEDVYVGPPALSNIFSHPLNVSVASDIVTALTPGVYKIAAIVNVRWSDDPDKNVIMTGFIEGAPLQITP